MSRDDMLKCLICFVLGFLVSRMMRGNGLSVGGKNFEKQDRKRENRRNKQDQKREHRRDKQDRKREYRRNKQDQKRERRRERQNRKNEDINLYPEYCTSSFLQKDGSMWCTDDWCKANTGYQYCTKDETLCCTSKI